MSDDVRRAQVDELQVQGLFAGPGSDRRRAEHAKDTNGTNFRVRANQPPLEQVGAIFDSFSKRWISVQGDRVPLPAAPPPPPPAGSDPTNFFMIFDGDAKRWRQVSHNEMLDIIYHAPRPNYVIPLTVYDALGVPRRTQPPPRHAEPQPQRPARKTGKRSADGTLKSDASARPASFVRPPDQFGARAVAFQPGHGVGSLAPGIPTDAAEFSPSRRRSSPQTGPLSRILLTTSTLALFDFLMGMEPAVPRAPRAQENKSPVPNEIKTKFDKVFPETFEAATMTKAGDKWLEALGDKWETRQVAEGVHWTWLENVEGKFEKVHLDNFSTSKDPEAEAAITKEVAQLLKDGRVKDVTDRKDEPGQALMVLPIFAIRQGAKWRIVWDAREINKLIDCPSFTMESIATAAKLVRPGDYMFTLDMWSGYHQLALREDLRAWCCFEWQGRTYEFQVLPFGLNIAPRTYQKVMLQLFSRWRSRGRRCVSYIDDGLWAASSEAEAQALVQEVLSDLQEFGLIVNSSKAHVIPSQAVTFLGYVIDASGPEVRLYLPEEKVTKIVEESQALLDASRKGPVQGVRLAGLLGKILAARYAYAPARLVTRELFACLRQLPLRDMRSESGAWHAVRDFSKTISIPSAAQKELEFITRMSDWNGCAWCDATPSRCLYTDGSGEKFGALVKNVKGGQEQDVLAWTQGDFELEEGPLHSTRSELEAVLRALANLEGEVRGETVLHRTDNIALYYALANGGYSVGANSVLNLLAKKVWATCLVLGVRLQCEFIGSEGILRSGADLLSRQTLGDDRSMLKSDVFKRVCSELSVSPRVDVFADRETRQAGLDFFTRKLEDVGAEGCLGFDGLVERWTSVVYAYPPLPLVDVAVQKAIKEVEGGATVVLIVPDWPQRAWMALLAGHRSVVVGKLCEVTERPAGAQRPVDARRTWETTSLRAFLLEPSR